MAVKPKLALIPSGVKASKVYSVLPSDGVGDFDFSRSGSATRINKDGLIEIVSSNVPRLNYPLIDGVVSGCPSLLLEPTKQNVLQRSEQFDNSYWINNGVTITANQIISPDGTQNADLLTGVSGGFGVVRFSTWSSTNKVASCFAKKGSSNLFKIANASGGVGGVTFDLENGTITNESSGFEGEIENYGNGWFRCTAIDTSARSGTFSLGVTAASESVYIWGAQLESGFKTSYIPTTNSAVTRSAETCNNAGDVNTFNDSEGVLYYEALFGQEQDTSRYISVNNDSSTDRVLIGVTGGTSSLRAFVITGGIEQAQIIESIDLSQTIKVAISYKEDEVKFYKNGILVGQVLSASMPSGLSSLDFSGVPTDQFFYGNVKQIQYFDTALTDLELQQLTTL